MLTERKFDASMFVLCARGSSRD